jgi:SMODS-associated NUDIX domain
VSFLQAVGEHLVADTIWLVLGSLVVARGLFRVAAWPVIVATGLRRHSPFRFSASAILRIKRGTEFVMVITPARGDSPPYWGPFGGVIKCRQSAVGDLYDLAVQPDWLASADGDMDRDLRIKMHGSRFWRFMLWYWRGEGRESPSAALSRELKEELADIGLAELDDDIAGLEFNVCPVQTTKLFRQDGMFHFRLFYVLDATGPHAELFEEKLLAHLPYGQAALISQEDIRRGAHAGIAVGGHSAFLIPGEKWVHRNPSYQ